MDGLGCEEIRQRQLADEYRARRLSPQESAAYEEHFFSCDQCFEDLRFSDGVATALRQDGASLFAPEIRGERLIDRKPLSRSPLAEWLRAVSGLFPRGLVLSRPLLASALALLVAVAAIGTWQIQGAVRAAHLRALSTPSAYPYIAADLRGGPDARAFAEGMALYNAGAYSLAADKLAQMLSSNPSDPDGQFYCGVARLMSDRPEEAVRALSAAVRLTPSSVPYRWYLAQAELKCGHAAAARDELERIVQRGGEYAAEARALENRVDQARGRR